MAIHDAFDGIFLTALDHWKTTEPPEDVADRNHRDEEAREQRWRQFEGDIRDFIAAEGIDGTLRAFANAVNPRLWRG